MQCFKEWKPIALSAIDSAHIVTSGWRIKLAIVGLPVVFWSGHIWMGLGATALCLLDVELAIETIFTIWARVIRIHIYHPTELVLD